MYIIAGLGNPGLKYKNTRHNAGYIAADFLLSEMGGSLKRKFEGKIAECRFNGEKVCILKPTTYMNLSGNSVRQAMNFYGIPPENLIVIYDDIDLPAGKLRVRKGGSAGTHNGMKSLIANVGSDFVRVRIGIGRPPAGGDLIRYVIGKLGRAQMAELTSSAQTAARAARKIVSEGVAAAQQEFN